MGNQDNSNSKNNIPVANDKLYYVSGIKIIQHENSEIKNDFLTGDKKIEEKDLNMNNNREIEIKKPTKIFKSATNQGKQKPKKSLRTLINESKQKRYLKSKNSKWYKFNRYVLNSLNQKKKLRIEWIIIGIISLILIAFFGTLLGIMQRFIGLNQPTSYPAVYNARDLNQAMWIVSIFCLVFLVVPYFYIMAAFFSGINQIHKSKTVHFIIWFTMIIDFLLLIACCGMLIAGYYGLDAYNLMRNLA